jgi:hypothetical protein
MGTLAGMETRDDRARQFEFHVPRVPALRNFVLQRRNLGQTNL